MHVSYDYELPEWADMEKAAKFVASYAKTPEMAIAFIFGYDFAIAQAMDAAGTIPSEVQLID